MEILALGDQKRIEELNAKIPDRHSLTVADSLQDIDLSRYDLLFDLNFDDNPQHIQKYLSAENLTVIIGAVKIQLAQLFGDQTAKDSIRVIGMNTLPTFINRSLAEFTICNKNSQPYIEQLEKNLNWQYRLVEDRVGMVTPRIIFMIINEACYTLEEGTASRDGIDLAMKLGTNYPQGPFEWADKIGIKEIYETLAAIHEDTQDERYEICPLLKTMYQNNESFY